MRPEAPQNSSEFLGTHLNELSGPAVRALNAPPHLPEVAPPPAQASSARKTCLKAIPPSTSHDATTNTHPSTWPVEYTMLTMQERQHSRNVCTITNKGHAMDAFETGAARIKTALPKINCAPPRNPQTWSSLTESQSYPKGRWLSPMQHKPVAEEPLQNMSRQLRKTR